MATEPSGGGSGLGEGFAEIFDERVLAAGDGAEAFVRRIGKGLGHVPPVRQLLPCAKCAAPVADAGLKHCRMQRCQHGHDNLPQGCRL